IRNWRFQRGLLALEPDAEALLRLPPGAHEAFAWVEQVKLWWLTEHVREVLVSLERFPHLTALDLSHNDLGAAGAALLAGLPMVGGLASLNLWHTQLGDEGVRLLVGRQSRLKRLDLSNNTITSAGAAALASCKYLSRLAMLDLRANAVGAEGTDALANSPHL